VKEKKPAQDTDKKKVLADYKRIGTTFVPPMVHKVGPWDFTRWSSQTLPELVWWDVLIDRVSHRFATRVSEEIAKHFKTKDKGKCWWAFISDYAQLGTDEMQDLKEHLKRANVLAQLVEGVVDFVNPVSGMSNLAVFGPTSHRNCRPQLPSALHGSDERTRK
jgi:hypothetical protein